MGEGALWNTIPESLLATFQVTCAIITPVLVEGALVERIRFSADEHVRGVAAQPTSRMGSTRSIQQTSHAPFARVRTPRQGCGPGLSTARWAPLRGAPTARGIVSDDPRTESQSPVPEHLPPGGDSGVGSVARVPHHARTPAQLLSHEPSGRAEPRMYRGVVPVRLGMKTLRDRDAHPGRLPRRSLEPVPRAGPRLQLPSGTTWSPQGLIAQPLGQRRRTVRRAGVG